MNLENLDIMMSSPSELSLECKPHQSYSMLLKSFGEKFDQTQNLEEFVARLEEERVKIDAFKRELPLCMQLLTNAMEASRQQLQSYKENQGRKPVFEEFIPLKNNNASGEENEKNIANTTDHNKANWMTSAQLWSPGSEEIKEKSTQTSSKEITDISISKLAFDNNFPCPTLALASTKQSIEIVEDKKNLERVNNYSGNDNSILLEQGKGGSNINQQPDSQSTGAVTNGTSTQQHRKARRCWSPDLHRRFVNALQMLGGSQVATPKQIRELMKVDGLTNDEVKSHLQKYRLHTRRPSPSPQVATSAPHLVVLGGIWVPPEYAAAAAHGGAPPAANLYGAHPTSHAPSPHYIAAPHGTIAQEFYTTAPQPLQSLHHLQHHYQHQQLYHHGSQMYNKPPSNSHTHSSPEPESRGTGHGGDRSESIEDGKSESSS